MKRFLTLMNTRSEADSLLIALYVLNVIDYLFTLILLSGGLFVEVNPLLHGGISGFGGFCIKCVLPLMLLMYLHLRLCASGVRRRAVTVLLWIGTVYYGLIDLMHVFWLSYSIFIFG